MSESKIPQTPDLTAALPQERLAKLVEYQTQLTAIPMEGLTDHEMTCRAMKLYSVRREIRQAEQAVRVAEKLAKPSETLIPRGRSPGDANSNPESV